MQMENVWKTVGKFERQDAFHQNISFCFLKLMNLKLLLWYGNPVPIQNICHKKVALLEFACWHENNFCTRPHSKFEYQAILASASLPMALYLRETKFVYYH